MHGAIVAVFVEVSGVAVHEADLLPESVITIDKGRGGVIGIIDALQFSGGVVLIMGDDTAGVGALFESAAGGVFVVGAVAVEGDLACQLAAGCVLPMGVAGACAQDTLPPLVVVTVAGGIAASPANIHEFAGVEVGGVGGFAIGTDGGGASSHGVVLEAGGVGFVCGSDGG